MGIVRKYVQQEQANAIQKAKLYFQYKKELLENQIQETEAARKARWLRLQSCNNS